VEVRLNTTAPDPAVVAAAVPAYVAAFSQPPYREGRDQGAAFLERVQRYARERDGFRLVTAWSDGGQVTGVCLAVLARSRDWWRDKAAAALPPEVAGRWLGDACLEIVHIAVVPALQRHGIGHLTHDVLIAGSPAPTGVLSCHPAAVPAQRFYLARGWSVLTRNLPAGDEDFWLMARDL
jgi:GNAT superfamily N-acetyltransferase